MKILLIIIELLLCIKMIANAQVKPTPHLKNITIQKGEKWYGGAVNEGHNMPFQEGYTLDLFADNKGINPHHCYYPRKEDSFGVKGHSNSPFKTTN